MNAYIYEGIYTPRASVRKGASAYSGVHPQELVASCLRTIGERQPELAKRASSVLIGCVSEVNDQGANLARNALLSAGMSQTVAGVTMNMCCGSGLMSIKLAADAVGSGSDEAIIAGGVESMSRVPMASDGGGMDGNNEELRKHLFQLPQGICADFLASRDKISRRELDQFSADSQRKAAAAVASGELKNVYAFVKDANDRIVLQHEDHVRAETTVETLGTLKPAFEKLGESLLQAGIIGSGKAIHDVEYLHTAGSSSGIADGASAVLLGNESLGKRFDATPKAKILSIVSQGCDPITMLTGPADCAVEALHRAGRTVKDVDLWEINEAFAIVPIQTIRKLELDVDRVNVRGGAIALGHPLGATGAILTASIVDTLVARDLTLGCVVLCVAGGQSIALVVERC